MRPIKPMTKQEQLDFLKTKFILLLIHPTRDIRIHSRKARMPKVVYKIIEQTKDFQVVEYKRNKFPQDFSLVKSLTSNKQSVRR